LLGIDGSTGRPAKRAARKVTYQGTNFIRFCANIRI